MIHPPFRLRGLLSLLCLYRHLSNYHFDSLILQLRFSCRLRVSPFPRPPSNSQYGRPLNERTKFVRSFKGHVGWFLIITTSANSNSCVLKGTSHSLCNARGDVYRVGIGGCPLTACRASGGGVFGSRQVNEISVVLCRLRDCFDPLALPSSLLSIHILFL